MARSTDDDRRGAIGRPPTALRRGEELADRLDRSSFVPLYYQLQETLKEAIESGSWGPGDRLPSEPELAGTYGVSRVVVRQALGILENDRQIVRRRGSGTFVARPKLDQRAGGLSRLLTAPRAEGAAIQVLDNKVVAVERSIRRMLGIGHPAAVLRITTLLSIDRVPLAISYSFFDRRHARALESAARAGHNLPTNLTLADIGVDLAHAEVQIEASQCGQFEADRFAIANQSPVFLVLCTEFHHGPHGVAPFEVARVEYRGDLLQFRLELPPNGRATDLSARWSLTAAG